MATRRYGLSRGETDNQVNEAVGAAVAADSLEVTIDLAANMTRNEVLLNLKAIERWILHGQWPPA